MEITIGKTAGFCYGVQRAVEGAIKELNTYKQIDCLGEIIHNKQVNEDLANKGLKIIDKIEESCGTTIIRSHGEPKEIYEIAKQNNVELKDYTCPSVSKVQNMAKKYFEDGYYVFLTGDKNHPEVKGIISYCGNNYSVIETKEDIKNAIHNFEKTNLKNILLISQTTYSIKKFDEIQKILQEKLSEDVEFTIKNTICNISEIRQKETEELAKKMDYMIIIGGKNSSNTQKLFEVAKLNCENSVWIESKEELDIEKIKKYGKIGIMAGASTPEKSINEVVVALKN